MRLIIRAAFALALLLVMAPTIARADSIPATVSYVKGDAMVIDPAGHSDKVMVEMRIAPGSTIKTGADGTVGLKLTPGATTVVGPKTTMKIAGLDYSQVPGGAKKREILLDLKEGALYNSLVKKDGQSDFRISTPEGVAAARGTDWSVTATAQALAAAGITVTVSVVDGSVTITLPDGSTIVVPANEVATSTNGSTVTYTFSGLTAAQKQEIIDAIEDAGFHLADTNGSTSIYSNESPETLNPANISTTPAQSPSQ